MCLHGCTVLCGICVQHARPRLRPDFPVFTEQGKKPRSFGIRPTPSGLAGCRPAVDTQARRRTRAASGDSLTIVARKGSERAKGLSSAPAGFLGREGVDGVAGGTRGGEGQQNWGQGAVGRNPQESS